MKRNLLIGFWRFKGFFLVNLLLLFCLSCEKEEPRENLPSVLDDDISFHDGRLVFKDFSTFVDYQDWLYENQGNAKIIAEKNRSIGFKSMTEYYFEGINMEENDPKFTEYVSNHPSVFYKETHDNSTLYFLPHSKILCYAANVDGIYQIGDKIYRIAHDYIYQIEDESNIEMLFLPRDQISTKDVKIMLSRPGFEAKGDLGQKTVNFTNDSRFRIVSSVREYSVWVENPGFTMWYYDIITNPQKKTFGVYFRAQLSTKSANDDGTIRPNCTGCTQESITGGYDVNTGLSQRVIYFGPDYKLDLGDSNSPAFSRGRLIDGSTQYIYIEWTDALASSPSYTYRRTSSLSDPY